MSYLNEFLLAIQNKDYPHFLKLWEEYCSGDALDAEEASTILRAVKKSDMAERVGRHVEHLLPLWQAAPTTPESEEVLKLILDIQTSNTPELADLATQYLERTYGQDPLFQQKLRIVGLRSRDHFQGAIHNFELLTHMRKGAFVYHIAGWGTGEVLDASYIREQVTLDFDLAPGKKDLSFATAFRTLEPVPEHHFLALRFGNPDKLEELAKKDPTEVIRMLLRDLGPKTAAEIKDELCDLVIPAEEWSRWWQGTRAKLKKDTHIHSPDDLKGLFAVRRQELSHGERLKEQLERQTEPRTITQSIYTFLRDFPEELNRDQGLRDYLAHKLQQLKELELSVAEQLQIHFLLEDMTGKKGDAPSFDFSQDVAVFERLLSEMPLPSMRKRFLMELRKRRPDPAPCLLALLTRVDSAFLRDYLLAELLALQAEKELIRIFEGLLLHPEQAPEAFFWYFQKIVPTPSTDKLPLNTMEGRHRLFEGLLILLSRIESRLDHRELVKKILALIGGNRYALVRTFMKEASLETVREFLLLATKCQSLTEHIKILHSLAEVAHPSLAKLGKGSRLEEDLDETIWTTSEGYQKLQQRIQQIATVETIENAREIEVARSHGDLRENSEFKFALEKRDRLQSELKSLSQQLSKARVLTPDDISPEDGVGIGTIADCSGASGQSVRVTLLGPWDANPDQLIFSYQSKFAKELAGLKVGDKFKMQGQEYTINKIASYFDTK